MKTQIRKPVPGKAKYSVEYKQQALELWRKSGRSGRKKEGSNFVVCGSLSICAAKFKYKGTEAALIIGMAEKGFDPVFSFSFSPHPRLMCRAVYLKGGA